jgi:hypothetical protein
MPTINTTDPKPGYVYDSGDDTWYPLAGIATQSLDGLTDVIITSATTGQALVYNGTNWVNAGETGDIQAVSAGTGISITSGGGPIPSIAVDTATVVDLSTAQTLSSKTLNYPILIAPEERLNVVASAATGTINVDLATAGTWYYTSNAGANHTLNFRHSSSTSLNNILTTGDSITAVWLNTNGATAYYPSVIQVDGATSGVSVKWQGGTAPTAGNASSIDSYVFSIIKTASATFTVLASQTQFA